MTTTSWGTWSPDKPVELTHPAYGLTLTPVLYSARANAVTHLPPSLDIRFGVRTMDGRGIAFRTRHEDTVIDWRYRFGDDGGVTVDWQARETGEWGLRFWVVLCVSGPEGTRLAYDPETGVLTGGPGLAIRAAKKPLMATFHDGLEALEAEFREKGYFYLASREVEGTFAALRFNLEEGPSMRLDVRTDGAMPERPSMPEEEIAPLPEETSPLQAVHDVISWNHVHDAINDRPYTVLTRFWNTHKFGGFGVWLDDILYNALLWGPFDEDRARQNLEAVFAWQTEEGNFPCLVTGNDAWLDRSQPPIASFVVWSLYLASRDRGLLDWAFPGLLRNHDWWWRRREPDGAGLVVYGTSLDVGDGLYKGTKLAAKDESSMDNMPVHDPAPFDEETGLLMSFDVGLNSLLALDGEVLARMAAELGREDDAARLAGRSARHRETISERLWDGDRKVFANRLVDGGFVEPLAPTSFFPMAAGAASAEQVEALVSGYLTPREKFGGVPGLPSVTRDDPAYADNVYWRGRIWGPLNFWTYQGLKRCGRDAEARALAEMGWRLFADGWRERLCGENYNAETGAILDQADTDPFYSWGALLPYLMVAEERGPDLWGTL